jgi:hypothetical protein
MKKLVCDRCGRELSEPADIELVLAGMNAWQNSVRARGEEPRGIFPCEFYVRCGGEMIVMESRTGSGKPGLFKRLFKRGSE